MADLTPVTHIEKVIAKASGDAKYANVDAITHLEQIIAKYGGGGGTDDYSDLSNKPKINNVTLDGNKSWADLGLSNPMHIAGRVDTVQDLPVSASEGDVYLVGLVADTDKEEYVYVSGGWEYLGTNAIEVDSAMSSTSENPVQNKVITEALTGKQDTIDSTHKLSAGNVDDSNAANKFVSSAEKTSIGTSETKLTGVSSTTATCITLTGGGVLYLSATEPTGTIPDGAIWIDTSTT